MQERAKHLKLGNVMITHHDHCPLGFESATRLNWNLDERNFDDEPDCLITEPVHLIESAVNAEFGMIQGESYVLFNNIADDGEPEAFNQYLVVDIPQSCECDFDVLKGILTNLWEIVKVGYHTGFAHGYEEAKLELTDISE